jgi:hypothetical protein
MAPLGPRGLPATLDRLGLPRSLLAATPPPSSARL